jgi:MFS family permease
MSAVIDAPARGWARRRLASSARPFTVAAGNSSLLLSQLAFGASWTAEAAFGVAIAVVAFRDGGATAVGLVAFVLMAPSALVVPIGSALADRFPRDRVLIWSCVVRAGATLAATAVLIAGGSHLAVYALAVVSTAAFRLFRPIHTALLPSLCNTPFELRCANVVRGVLNAVSALLGPLAAALLLALSSPPLVFVAAATIALVAGALLLGLTYEAPPRGRPQPLRRIARETVEGFQALRHHSDAGLVIGLSLVQTLTLGFLDVFVVVLALDQLGMGDSGVGLLTAAMGAGALAASSLGASTFANSRRLAALQGLGVVCFGIPLTLSGAFPYAPVVLALMCVVGLGNALVDTGLHTLPARLVPEHLLARVFGVKASLAGLSVAVGAFITPFAIALLGVRGALAVLGLLAPAASALAWWRLRAIDEAIAQRDDEIALLASVRMFNPLPMPAIDNLALRVDSIEVAAAGDVFTQGDHGDRFYVIEEGEADVIGDGRLIRTLESGDSFGEIALLRDMGRTATVRARTPLRLRRLERNEFCSTVTTYASSEREADALVLDRLRAFAPA